MFVSISNCEYLWIDYANPLSISLGEVSNIPQSGTFFYENPATLRFSASSVSLNYSNLYGINDLYLASIFTNIDLKPLSVGVSYSSLGIKNNMSQNIMCVSFAREITRRLMVGMNFNGSFENISGYEGNDLTKSKLTFNGNTSAIFSPLDSLDLTFSIRNIFSKDQMHFNWGGVFYIKKFVLFAFEMKDNVPHEGIRVNFYNTLFLDFGHNNNVFTFGLSIKAKSFKFHMSLIPNNDLGSSYFFSLSYKFGESR